MTDQLDLFGGNPADDWEWFDLPPARVTPPTDTTRYYQYEAHDAFFECAKNTPWVLEVLATGLGKSRIAGMIARTFEGRVLILDPRLELITQMHGAVEHMTGEFVEVEQADIHSSSKARVVVASVASMNEKRLRRMGRDRFDLIITDETHHATAASYSRIYDWFRSTYGLGLTATPDRSDGKALGMRFDDVAYRYNIRSGIENGFLAKYVPCLKYIKELDISGVSKAKTAGGLNLSELDAATIRAVEGILHTTFECADDRRGIFFWPGVRCAKMAAERANKRRPGSSAFASGEECWDERGEKIERRELMRRIKGGEVQYLHNCDVATEGFDWPACNLIVHGRPTLSRALHTQMDGRGGRVLPGVIDHLPRREQRAERLAAIAASEKPDCLMLDFVGNHGRHQLVTTLDVLGGDYTEAEVKRAKDNQKAGEMGSDALAALEKARAELKALAAVPAKIEKIVTETKWVEAFATLGMKVDAVAEAAALNHGHDPITDGQVRYLAAKGVPDAELRKMTKVSAKRLIGSMEKRAQVGLATYRQLRVLADFGIPSDPRITHRRAQAGITYVQNKGWKKADVDPVKLREVVYYEGKKP